MNVLLQQLHKIVPAFNVALVPKLLVDLLVALVE